MLSIFILSINALEKDKRKDKLLGVDSKKLLSTDDDNYMNRSMSDNDENVPSYNIFAKKEKQREDKVEDLKRKKFKDFQRSLEKEKEKRKDLSSKDALMTGQSSYHAPLSSVLMKGEDETNKNKDNDDIKTFMKNNDEISNLLTKMLTILKDNKEILNNSLNSKKKLENNDKNDKNNKPRDLIDFKVIEVENLEKGRN
ncbi:hypothetical protein TUBRATIS_19890 [Tubulinosema ratisbonensis]|uniref:Uncharacterized protein n=1 Tax=Tubulinosema ratisbonensis TaxID=291195 RepID=A0A437AKH9_9MICR|nr:hypothetical protein TUBRATIS_19890 [Tubulinosema ratisbonensis]